MFVFLCIYIIKEKKSLKKKKSKRKKNRTKVCNLTKTQKDYLSCRKCWYKITSVKIFPSYSQVLFTFLKVLMLLSTCAKFQVNKQEFPIRRKVWLEYWGSFTANTTQRELLQGQNTLVRIFLIESTEPSDTLDYEPFFKHCILQTVLHIFLLYIFVLRKIYCSKM